MNVIQVNDLTKKYGRLTAVDRISFSVDAGQVFGFLGPNGSGKTTTIGMLLEIISPDGGDIRMFEQYDRGQLHHARKRVGATLETPNFYPYLSGRENLRVVARIKEVDERAIAAALDAVGLATRAGDAFSRYSLGMKQRLAIAGAMIGNPDLVILDEPANGLDPAGMREIRDIIKGLAAQGKTIFVSSHLLHEVEQTCTHVAIIKKGRILMQGSLASLIGGHTIAVLRADDMERLRTAAASYAGAASVDVDKEGVIVDLADPNLATLNEYLSSQGVFLSYLAPRKQSLEDVFMELTQGGNRNVGAAA
ncbi:MAG: ABC transporter ATP-binding protein [Longimicrobiales bacterium]